MKKKLKIAAAMALGALVLLLVWRLDIPHWKKLDLSKLTAMPAATTVLDAGGSPVGALRGAENRVWAPLDSVPERVQDAFIAAEDLRFYRHHGVDVHRVLGALWQDVKTLSYAQGASTITQQLIKLTHLSQDKNLSRKVQEIALALQLERRMSKPQILEAYLNAVYFGHGAYGIEAASNVYFDKTAAELTLAEGALLAGIIKAPSTYAPHLNPERAVARRNGILDIMAENGMITEAERDAARSEALRLSAGDDDSLQFAWYLDAALSEAQAKLGLSADEVINGGYTIETGLDADMQTAAEALFADADSFPDAATDGTPAQAALVALDAASGEIKALVGGRSYDVMRGLNRATQMRRQPGSAFKPVSTYAAAVDAFGYVPTSIIDDTPRTFAGGYAPGNAGGGSNGPVTLREALSRSLNIATVDLADSIGIPALRNYAERFGLPLSPRDANLSMALGALTDGVSPAELGAAYCALANGGTRVSAHVIRRILDADGRVVYKAPAPQGRAVTAQSAYMLTDMLRTAAQKGSARALSDCGIPVAGKTGTVAEPGGGTRDIWTVAYTPQLAVSVWMGFDDPDAAHALPASAGGGGHPARLCAGFLRAVSDELGGEEFPRPKGVRTAVLDALALENNRVALLGTERMPAQFAALELFHDDDLPREFTPNWSQPSPVADFRLLTGTGETPVVAFTCQEDWAEYVLTRRAGGETRQIAVLSGEAGTEVRYADDAHDLAQPAEYTLMPRNARLYAAGELLSGPLSPVARYEPGGLLNKIMGSGTAEAELEPAEVGLSGSQSLFD